MAVLCKVAGCEKTLMALGYCPAHYNQMNRHGKIVSIESLLHQNKGKTCKVEWCDRGCFSKSMCRAHYEQFRQHGKILKRPIKAHNDFYKGKSCKVEGCEGSPIKAFGCCERHYQQIKRHGKIISAKRLLSPRIGKGMRTTQGYIYLYRPEHPYIIWDGWVKRANLVWEENTGHVIAPGELIHHKNLIRADDKFENLIFCKNKSDHMRIHQREKGRQSCLL